MVAIPSKYCPLVCILYAVFNAVFSVVMLASWLASSILNFYSAVFLWHFSFVPFYTENYFENLKSLNNPNLFQHINEFRRSAPFSFW